MTGRRHSDNGKTRSAFRIPSWIWGLLATLAVVTIVGNTIVIVSFIGDIAEVQRTTCQALILQQIRSLGSIDPDAAKQLAVKYDLPAKLIPNAPNPLVKRLFKAKDTPELIRLSRAQIRVLASRCKVT